MRVCCSKPLTRPLLCSGVWLEPAKRHTGCTTLRCQSATPAAMQCAPFLFFSFASAHAVASDATNAASNSISSSGSTTAGTVATYFARTSFALPSLGAASTVPHGLIFSFQKMHEQKARDS
jgi:hypothetical protein